MKNIKAARRYAMALMAVAEERRVTDAVATDLEAVGRVLAGSRDLRLLVASPVISAGKKLAVFREIFGARTGKETLEFLALLIRKQREALLPAVVEEFLALRDTRANIVNVDVTAAVDLSTSQQTALTGALERRTGKQVRLRLSKDPAIAGGLVVKIGDTVLDGSVRHQLARIRRRFVGEAGTKSMRKG
jgi:F-type H+-transporting ATPase subunit delta